MRKAEESKAEFCARIMRQTGFEPNLRGAHDRYRRKPSAPANAERDAFRAEMDRRCHERFDGETSTGGVDWSARK